jgi:hypothetical protein
MSNQDRNTRLLHSGGKKWGEKRRAGLGASQAGYSNGGVVVGRISALGAHQRVERLMGPDTFIRKIYPAPLIVIGYYYLIPYTNQ